MNLFHYAAKQMMKGFREVVYPERVNCWLKLQCHKWNGEEPERGWSTKKCDCCGRIVNGCGM